MIETQFGGVGNNTNTQPMKQDDVNAYPNGTCESMEDSWGKAIDYGQTVDAKNETVYTDASGRPSSFEVTEIIDGVEKTKTITNL